MNGCDFGPGSPGCIDCWDGHCTMNCSPRGRADLPTRRDEARTVLHMPEPPDPPDPMKAIADVLRSTLPAIPITFSNPRPERPHPFFELSDDGVEWFPIHSIMPRLDEPAPMGITEEAAVASRERARYLPAIWERRRLMDDGKHHEIADAMGLRIFADPRVPPGEIWMGIDLSNGPDVTAYVDSEGNIHIITPGKEIK